MSNLSILERNIIDSFGAFSNPEAVETHFLSSLDRCGTFAAERIANEFGDLSDKLSPMLDAAVRPYAGASGRAKGEIATFIQERHLNYRAGGNLKLQAEQGAK